MEIFIAGKEHSDLIKQMALSFRDYLQRTEPQEDCLTDSIEKLINSDDADFIICLDESEPSGYVLQRYRYSMWATGMEAAIEDLFVRPECRGRSIGKSLIEFALRRAKEKDCTTVCVDTNENNAASTKIYTGFGFNAISKRWNGRQIFYRLDF